MLKKLRHECGDLVMQARNMHADIEKEGRAFKPEEKEKWEKLNLRIDELKDEIKIAERAAHLADFSKTSTGVRTLGATGEQRDDNSVKDLERRGMRNYLINGLADVPEDLRDVTKRAFSVGTNNVGGYTVPTDMYNKLEVALLAYGGMLESCDIMRTDNGHPLQIPTFNYTSVKATIIGEGSARSADSSTPFGQITMNAYTYASPILPLSVEFLQDTIFGEDYIVQALSESIARGFNAHATVGTGSGQPQGIVGAATSGKAGASGQVATWIFNDVIDLIHSVDPAYRPLSGFMMHDTTLAIARKLVDSNGRPIFMPGFDGMANPMPDKIYGYPVVINQDMPVMAASAKSVIFGNLKKYKARIARNVQVLRLNERYADQGQVAYLLFARMDGKLLDAGTHPVKYYQNPAS